MKAQTVNCINGQRAVTVLAAIEDRVLYNCQIGTELKKFCCMTRGGFEARFPEIKL